jgi:hypothetical protein
VLKGYRYITLEEYRQRYPDRAASELEGLLPSPPLQVGGQLNSGGHPRQLLGRTAAGPSGTAGTPTQRPGQLVQLTNPGPAPQPDEQAPGPSSAPVQVLLKVQSDANARKQAEVVVVCNNVF